MTMHIPTAMLVPSLQTSKLYRVYAKFWFVRLSLLLFLYGKYLNASPHHHNLDNHELKPLENDWLTLFDAYIKIIGRSFCGVVSTLDSSCVGDLPSTLHT